MTTGTFVSVAMGWWWCPFCLAGQIDVFQNKGAQGCTLSIGPSEAGKETGSVSDIRFYFIWFISLQEWPWSVVDLLWQVKRCNCIICYFDNRLNDICLFSIVSIWFLKKSLFFFFAIGLVLILCFIFASILWSITLTSIESFLDGQYLLIIVVVCHWF